MRTCKDSIAMKNSTIKTEPSIRHADETRHVLPIFVALLILSPIALHAADAPAKRLPDNALMLAGDWLPEDSHQIDYEKLPRAQPNTPSSVTSASTLALVFINTRIWLIMMAASGPCGAMAREGRGAALLRNNTAMSFPLTICRVPAIPLPPARMVCTGPGPLI